MKPARTLALLLVTVLALAIGSPAKGMAAMHSTSQVCASPYTDFVGKYPLFDQFHVQRPDIGSVFVYKTHDELFACAYTESGSKTWGQSKHMAIYIGYRARGDIYNPISWAHSQIGDFLYWAGPVYTNKLKPDQCVVALGEISDYYKILVRSTYCY